MRTISLKLLRKKLHEHVHLAAGGEAVLVMVEDRVVAVLGPPQPVHTKEVADGALAQAVRDGWLTPPLAPNRTPPARRPLATSRALSEQIEWDRGDR